MARWKLINAHYINVPGTEWQYSETDRQTGRPVRRIFNIPLHLNPLDPGDWNYRWGSKDNEDGEIIVCLQGRGDSKDIAFIGDPTPDMIPLDDEAKAISASFAHLWDSKPENAEVPYSQSLIDKFQDEMASATASAATKPVEIAGLKDLVEVLAAQAKNTQDMLQALSTTRRL